MSAAEPTQFQVGDKVEIIGDVLHFKGMTGVVDHVSVDHEYHVEFDSFRVHRDKRGYLFRAEELKLRDATLLQHA